MTWKPSDHTYEQVRGCTDYHFDREIHSWRHQQPGGESPTLRISRYVLQHNAAFVILYHLDRLNVAGAIRSNPEV
jgi:hypothetical protein